MGKTNLLVASIVDFAQTTPFETVEWVVQGLESRDNGQTEYQNAKMLAQIHNPTVKSKLTRLFDCWLKEYPQISSVAVALSLQSTALTQQLSSSPFIELVWTGPTMPITPLRRTDQALIEMINGARQRLVVVSFAVYKAQAIITAIENALKRNVEVIICLEDADESKGKVTLSGITAFSKSIFRLATFYHWPLEMRIPSEDGKFGSLHAKLAVADRSRTLISSANLTDYAMELNIEMGVLVDDPALGQQVDGLISDMIIRQIFYKIAS